MVIIAVLIFLFSPAKLFFADDIRLVAKPSPNEMIAAIDAGSNCGKNPRQAIFELEPIDLNRTDAEVLASLRGIGPGLAGRIVAYRDDRGGFRSVSDLLAVKGIGQRKLAGIIDDITVGSCGK